MDDARLKSVDERTKKNTKDIEELSKTMQDLKKNLDDRLAYMNVQFAAIFTVLSNKSYGEKLPTPPAAQISSTSLGILGPQALRVDVPKSAVVAYNSEEEVIEVKNLPDYEGETTAKQVLGVQRESKNGAYKVLEGMTISVATCLQLFHPNYIKEREYSCNAYYVLDGTTISVATSLRLFHPNHITEKEYSSHSFSGNEVSSSLYNSLSFNPRNLLIDGGPQPPTLKIGSVEVTHRLFDKLPQLITVEPNQEMYADRYYILPLLDCVLQIFDPGSSSLIVCCDFMDTSGVKHDFVKNPGNSNVELWFGKILSFVFDPGGSYLCYNACDPSKLTRDEHECLAKSVAWNFLSWSDAFIVLAVNPDELGPIPRLSQTYAKFFRDNVLPCKLISVLVYIMLGAAEYSRTLYDDLFTAFPYIYSYGLSLESLDWKFNLQCLRLFGVLTTMIQAILMDLSANGSLLETLVKDGLVTPVDIILHPGTTEFDTDQSCSFRTLYFLIDIISVIKLVGKREIMNFLGAAVTLELGVIILLHVFIVFIEWDNRSIYISKLLELHFNVSNDNHDGWGINRTRKGLTGHTARYTKIPKTKDASLKSSKMGLKGVGLKRYHSATGSHLACHLEREGGEFCLGLGLVCHFFLYILEDKDVFKRVGKRIVRTDITWVIMEVSKDVQNNCIIMRWCEMARYLRLSCDNANDGYMLQTEHMVKG